MDNYLIKLERSIIINHRTRNESLGELIFRKREKQYKRVETNTNEISLFSLISKFGVIEF